MANVRTSNTRADVDLFTKDFKRLQSQKWRLRGGVEARMLLSLGMYFGEHGMVQTRDSIQQRSMGKDSDNNRLSLTFNLLRKAAHRRMGRLWGVRGEFGATPSKKESRAFDNADVVNDLVDGLDYKLKEATLHWKRVWWLVLAGVCAEHTPWVEDTQTEEPIPAFDPESGELLWREAMTQKILPQSQVEMMIQTMNLPPERFTVLEQLATVGDVGAEIISPFNLFIDNSVTNVKEMQHGQALHIMQIKTLEWVKEIFGEDAAKQIMSRPGEDLAVVKTRLLDRGPTLASMNLRDLLPAVQGSRSPDDPPMCVVGTRYQPACKDWPHGRRSIYVPNQCMLDDGETPYGEIPVTDFHYTAPTVSFWTGDFLTDLIPAQKFLNKRWSQTGEAANASIHEVLLLSSQLSAADIPSDLPGVVEGGLADDGSPLVQPMQRSQLPPWFLESIKEVAAFIDYVGGSDLMQHRSFPGQLRGPLALPMLQELLDSEDGPFYSHLGERLAVVKQQRINRVKQFYPPIRTLHYTNKNTKKDEVLVFHTDNVLRAGTEYEIRVDEKSLVPQLRVMKRAQVIEELSGPAAILYTDQRTGKLDVSKIAAAMNWSDVQDEDRNLQTRKLAQHLISRLWNGQPLPPNVPFPFWDHSAILDELYGAMVTTEFLEASPFVQTQFITFYEKSRAFLAQIQQAQMDSVQNQMLQGAVAQATQQAAAKATSIAVDAAVGEIQQQAQMSLAMRPDMRQQLALGQGAGAQRALPPGPQ